MVSAFLEDFEMAGLKRRILLVCALVLSVGPIQVALAEANAVEIDVYEIAICWQDIRTPDGTTVTVLMTGQATVHVFFEGPEEGTAYDDDGDTLDEVQTEMVELNLSGYSAMLGPVRMRLNTNYRSTGMMEETISNRKGVLDVPPFGSGAIESFFDIFFEVEMAGQVFFGERPMRWRGLLREKPAGPLDLYENLQEIRLLDSNGQLTLFSWGANRFRPNPTVEVDVFETAMCWQDIRMPDGIPVTVLMTGRVTEHVFFEGPEEGSANDDDGDGLDEVQTEMVELNLRGYSAMLGPVRMRLNTNLQSMGEMEEETNGIVGVLDVPPFGSGTVKSFFDVFFEVEMLGQVFYGRDPMHLRGTLTQKPAGPLDLYENLVDIQLMDENGNPTNFYFSAGRYRPNLPVEIDVLDTSIGSLVLRTPSGQEYAVGLMGQSEIHVFFEGAVEGSANDDDGDGLDEVETELVGLSLSGSNHELREVHLRLNRNLRSLGEMEERANNNTGVLDVPPFASEGMIDSFFDVFFEVEVEMLGQTLYGEGPMRLRGVFSEKPAAPGEIYELLEEMRLVDARGDPTGFILSATRYEPIACGDAEHPYPIGDLNKDCEVNFFDIAILSLHWLDCSKPQCD